MNEIAFDYQSQKLSKYLSEGCLLKETGLPCLGVSLGRRGRLWCVKGSEFFIYFKRGKIGSEL